MRDCFDMRSIKERILLTSNRKLTFCFHTGNETIHLKSTYIISPVVEK